MLTEATRTRLFEWRNALDAPLDSMADGFCRDGPGYCAGDYRSAAAGEGGSTRRHELISGKGIGPGLAAADGGAGAALCRLDDLGHRSFEPFCYREFVRATGLFRERMVSSTVVIGIIGLTFSVLDNWYALFVSLPPITAGAIATAALIKDRPKQYLQRVALGLLSFMLFGVSFAHLAYFANDTNYRPIIFWLLISVELNDVFAYCCGKIFGRRKLAPHTSPNKTIGGSIGPVFLTTILAATIAHYVFRGTVIDTWPRLLLLGATISVLGQVGDLIISAVKRDLDIKDMNTLFPGHGGLLDRFDSLILVAAGRFIMSATTSASG